MRYIITHLIRGEAKAAHEQITKDLAEKFDSFPIHDRIQPHLTLKRWFELEKNDMDFLFEKLSQFANSYSQTDYSLSGYGHFDTDVIYVDVKASETLLSNLRDLSKELHTVPNLTFDEFDQIDHNLHATITMSALKAFDYDQIWNYLHDSSNTIPNFNLKFDNIAVMRRGADKWEIVKVWEISALK